MVYKLRSRENIMKRETNPSYSDTDSISSETRPRTRSQRRIMSLNSQEAASGQMDAANGASSSHRAIRGRKRGRPTKKRDEEGGDSSGQDDVVSQKCGGTRKRQKSSFCIRGSARSRRGMTPSQLHRTIFSWLIDSGTIQENENICYIDRARERVLKNGRIRRTGILCSCCNEEMTAWELEYHAGCSNRRKPYENIFVTRTGVGDQHDDACVVCSDGGQLICCDRCPSTYHHTCAGMEEVPQGAWCCPYCVCKFCGFNNGEKDEFLKCFQCEKKFHRDCSQGTEERFIDLNRPSPTSFCGQSCREIFEKLEEDHVGVRNELGPKLSWTLLRRMDMDSGVYFDDLHQRTEFNSKIAMAWRVMDESFTHTTDRQTKINVIRSTVYNCGSNYPRINFSGFYTAVLEEGSEIISAASLRIHGTRLAEMPFIATRWIHRNKGMFRKLLGGIESLLRDLKVENLVIPSIQTRVSKWIDGHGFKHIEDELKKEIFYLNTLMFHSAIRLQKNVVACAAEPVAKVEVDEGENKDQQNCLPSENSSPKPMLLSGNGAQVVGSSSTAMEVDDSEKNGHQNGPNLENKLKRAVVVDLNLEPPVDDEYNSDITDGN
ncbi:hypothetical protein L1049_023227 [Liquidambar formosana]|uniref:PHD-type domain-containing protein n=1 Tax=Liquidambar formosana TaxID=63359 RepID=A0AAP0RDQ6_LIQFO